MQLTGDVPRHFAERMGALLGPDFPADLTLAVSGGGDSMAMLHLAAGWARVYGIHLRVGTVDHGLRDESVAEAALVADECAGLGLAHRTLRWTGWDGSGNLQDAARQARLTLFGEWMGGSGHLVMAHTADDQAETVLMRLARGSGVDGLAGMAPVRQAAGITIVRPLLDVPRRALRHYAETLKIPFVDDPSNADPRFARVRMRHLIGQEGLEIATLTDTAHRMARARIALGRRAAGVARDLLIGDPTETGAVMLDRDGFERVEEETQMRLLAGALQFVASNPYRPREEALDRARETVLAGGTVTLHGGVLIAKDARIGIIRESKAVADIAVRLETETVWDTRWHLSAKGIDGVEVRALGADGYRTLKKQAPDLPGARSLDAQVWQVQPALWRHGRLIAFAAARFGPDYAVGLVAPGGNLPQSLEAH